MTHRLLAVLVFVPTFALAGPYKEALTDAAESLEDALHSASRRGGSCAASVNGNLERGVHEIDSIRRGTTDWRINEIQLFVGRVEADARQAGCHHKVTERLSQAIASLTRARSVLEGVDERRDQRKRDWDRDLDNDQVGHQQQNPYQPPLPPQPQYQQPPPQPVYQAPPPPAPVARGCGTEPDPGCEVQRGRGRPMEAGAFLPFLDTLKRTPSDLTRQDMCRSVLANNFITAKQFGWILETFSSDLVKMDVAKLAAPHVVNPQLALGLAQLFRSSIQQRDFTALMSGQR